MKTITVVAAVWQDSEGRYFLAQRNENQAQSGFWEFPGGKVEAGEAEKSALARELMEELGIVAEIGDFLLETIYQYEADKIIKLRAYRILSASGQPMALEHQALAWVEASALLSYELAPADVALAKWLQSDLNM